MKKIIIENVCEYDVVKFGSSNRYKYYQWQVREEFKCKYFRIFAEYNPEIFFPEIHPLVYVETPWGNFAAKDISLNYDMGVLTVIIKKRKNIG